MADGLSGLCLASYSTSGACTGTHHCQTVWHPACDMYGSCLLLLWR